MSRLHRLLLTLPLLLAMAGAGGATPPAPAGPAVQAKAPAPNQTEVLARSAASDWRPPDPAHTLYLDLSAGRVVIELAPDFAPQHVQNIERLAKARYYDGLGIIRVQDNYVVQWGDAANRHPTPGLIRSTPPEFERQWSADMPFTPLADGDVYAPQVGFSSGLPVAGDRSSGKLWLAHCYGMVGVGRDEDPASGSGAELYVVIGHAPRHLDRNVALVGRVLKGMDLLSSLPRGTAAMGFYEKPDQATHIRRIRLEADVPAADREHLQVLRTDTATFTALVESRRNRRETWFARPAGRIDLCNVPLPVRVNGHH